ncbi:hypothetical protein ACIBCN_34270 [Nocardia sp. NPDC051052]
MGFSMPDRVPAGMLESPGKSENPNGLSAPPGDNENGPEPKGFGPYRL